MHYETLITVITERCPDDCCSLFEIWNNLKLIACKTQWAMEHYAILFNKIMINYLDLNLNYEIKSLDIRLY